MSTTREYQAQQAIDAGFDPHDAELVTAYRPNLNWSPVTPDASPTLDSTAAFEVQDDEGFEQSQHWSLRSAQQDVVDGGGYQIMHFCTSSGARLDPSDDHCPVCGAL